MTFAELVVAVHDWMRRLPPRQVRAAVQRQLESEEGVEGCRGISVDAVLVMVRMGLGPGLVPIVLREAPAAPRKDEAPEPALAPEPAAKPGAEPEAAERAPSSMRHGRPSKRAQALLCEQLKDGPKPAAQIEAAAQAAEIPKHVLLAATDALGVRTQRRAVVVAGLKRNTSPARQRGPQC